MQHRTQTRRIVIVALCLAVVLAACGGTATNDPGGRSPAATGSAAADDGSSAPPTGSAARDASQLDLGQGAALDVIDREAATRALGRAGAGLGSLIGPDGPSLASTIDRQASDGLWRLIGDTGTATGAAEVASIRNDFGLRVAAIPQPGVSLLGSWGAAMMIIDSRIGSLSPYSKSDHMDENVTLGPNAGTVTTDSTVTITVAGSKLSVDVELTTKGEINDAAGHLVFRINGTGHAHIEIDGCPDAQGTSPVSMAFTSSEDYFTGGGGASSGHSWHENDEAQAKVAADDEANLDHASVDMAAKQSIKGGTKSAPGGQSDLIDSEITFTQAATLGRDGSMGSGTYDFTASGATRGELDRAHDGAEKLLGIAVITAASAAERFWRSGKCIEVVPVPNGGDVAANSQTNVVVHVRHRFEGNELDKPVEATIAGVKTIEPSDQKVAAPATFVYVAGPKPGDSADITFRSVSNRGIAEVTVHFTVGGGWNADRSDGAQSIKGQKCDGLGGVWRIDGLIEDATQKETVTWIATLDATSLAGPYTYKSVSVLKGLDIVSTGTGHGHVTAVIQADGSILMTFGGITADSVTVGAGTEVRLSVPVPAHPFTWAPGGTCPN